MRPIRLKIKGLNSFVEEQTIDFEQLTRQGFFGIFGPTGSGKSTILDAMILALYGMKAISRGTNEFVNKNCKKAEVVYEFQITGKEIRRYRVEREFKSGEKGCKSGKCRLLDITEGEYILEETVTGVDRACVDIIGLTADDFMRTVVLPQGRFSEFLKVSGKDRREILERLFRLEEYGVRLEERIASALKAEQGDKARLLGQAEVLGGYSKELLNEKQREETQQKEELERLEFRLQKIQKEVEENQEIWKLQTEEQKWKKKENLLVVQEVQISQRQEALRLADKAAQVMPLFASVRELEEKSRQLEQELGKIKKEYEDWKEKADTCRKAFSLMEEKKETQEAALVLAEGQAKEALSDYEALPQLLRLCREKEQERRIVLERIQELQQKEEALSVKKTEEEAQSAKWEAERQRVYVSSEHREAMERFTELYHELVSLLKELEEKEALLLKKKAQMKVQKETLEAARMQADEEEQSWIIRLQSKLKEGEPCPVCGSHHNVKESMTELSELESQYERLSREKEEKKQFLQGELEKRKIQSLSKEKERIRQMDLRREALEKEQYRIQKQRIQTEEAWNMLQNEKKMQEEIKMEIELSLAPLRESIAQKQTLIASKIGAGRDPQTYLRDLEEQLSMLRKGYADAKTKSEEAEAAFRKSEERWQLLSGTKKGNAEALSNAEVHFQEALKSHGFQSAGELQRAYLSREIYQAYEMEVKTYEEEKRETVTQLRIVRERLNGRAVEQEHYENSVKLFHQMEQDKKEKERLLIEGRQEIRQIQENSKRQEEILNHLKIVEHKIAVLEDLRGVTRGKRFVEYMAAERLRYISKSASKRLYEITNGNYELEINKEGEFVMRDNKNGGVLRPTSTLSGGETFVTSLALALALSAEIQLKGTAPLELFFLDEGFGSLDETLLDVVMESLERIHNDRLKVGIISHVESVKMRVPVRLVVSPAQSGISGSKVKIEHS